MSIRLFKALNNSRKDGFRTTPLDSIEPIRVVAAILAYVTILFMLRVSISPFLEIDEAQFMGAVDLRWVYPNSHPPLMNWLVRGALEVTGWNWPLALALVRALLLAATHLFVFDAARRLGGTAAGILAVAMAMLMPQVSWMSAHTLAHSLLAMAAAAGVVHAVVLVVTRGGLLPFAWLGLAAAIGVAGKYNVALLLAPLAAAIVSVAPVRARFATWNAILAPLVFVPLVAPVLYTAAEQPAVTTERLSKLYREGPFAPVDLPVLGIDGVLSLLVAVIASGGVVLALVALFGRTPVGDWPMRKVLWRTLLYGIGAMAVFALAADVDSVHERYLTPLMMALPVVAALHLAGWPYRRFAVLAGLIAAVAVPIGIGVMVMADNHRWARPYAPIARDIAAAAPLGAITVETPDEDLSANIVLGLRQAGRTAVVAGDRIHPRGPILVRVWPGTGPVPDDAFPAAPDTCLMSRMRLVAPYTNLTKRMMAVSVDIILPDGGCAGSG